MRFSQVLVILLCLSACSSQKNAGNSPVYAGATVAAVVVGGVLAPVAAPFSLFSYYSDKKVSDEIQAHFSPIYQERMLLIAARNPEQDAKDFFAKNVVFFFPTTLEDQYYAGLLDGGGLCGMRAEIGAPNVEVIQREPEAKGLFILMDIDPEHKKVKDKVMGYYKVYGDFQDAGFAYKKQFNQHMRSLSGLGCPVNKP